MTSTLEPEQKKKTGRPPKLNPDDKTLSALSNLAKIQCTQKEAASVLEVSEPTFVAFLKLHLKAREAWDNGQHTGRASLRRQQFRMSETNAAMAIWLGKQYLGQTDKLQSDINATFKFSDEFEKFVHALNERKEHKVINGSVAAESGAVVPFAKPVRS